MRSLEGIIADNAEGSALFHQRHFIKLCTQAAAAGDFAAAKKFDGFAQDFLRFRRGEIEVWPDEISREARLFEPSIGRDFKKEK